MKLSVFLFSFDFVCLLPFLLWLLGAAILGWLIRHFMYRTKKSAVAAFEAKISNQESELENWKSKNLNLQRNHDAAINQYSFQLKESESNLTHYKSKIATHESSYKVISQQLATANNKLETVADLEKKLDSSRNNEQKAKADHDAAVKILHEYEAKIASLESAASDWRGKLSSSQAELQAAKLRFDAKEREDRDFAAKLDASQRETNDWKSKHESLRRESETHKMGLSNSEKTVEEYKKSTENTELRLRKALEWEAKYASLETNFGKTTAESNAKSVQIESAANENRNLKAAFANLETEKNNLQNSLSNDSSKLKEWSNRYATLEAQLQNVSADASTKTNLSAEKEQKINQLNQELAEMRNKAATSDAERNKILGEKEEHKTQLNELSIKIQTLSGEKNQLETELKTKNSELENEILSLQIALESKPSGGIQARSAEEIERDQSEILAKIRATVTKDNLTFGKADALKKDNLKKIRGINPFIEKKMNAAGISTFRQVAYLSSDEQSQLNRVLELSKNKFQKEEWAFQAKRLIGLISDESPDVLLGRIAGRTTELNFDRLGVATADNKDNLQLINYITAFDEAKLNALGIFKFSQIANLNKTDAKLLNKILEIEEGRISTEDWVTKAGGLNKSSAEDTLNRIKSRQELVNWEKIGRKDASQLEDLQVISGIGLFIEQKLYALGIVTIEQISKFIPSEEVELNNILELVPGHIQSDEWAAQARKILRSRR